jgi:cysteine synthase
MKIYENISQVFGNTPLVKIQRLFGDTKAIVVGKLEFFNPTSSVKDRLAIAMVDGAEKSGALQPGGTIIEATSGNTGIALASVGAARGYRVILTMPDSMSKERRALLRALGATLVLTPASSGMRGAVEKSEEIGKEIGGVLVRQFENQVGPEIHRVTTAAEIWNDTDGKVAAVVMGVGTGGTVTGVGQALKQKNPEIKIFAVQPEASPILTGGSPAGHPLQGIGANFIPPVLDTSIYDEVLSAPNEESFTFAKRAGQEEGILAGISSGAALWAASRIVDRAEFAGKIVVVVMASYGERYLSTALYKEFLDEPETANI